MLVAVILFGIASALFGRGEQLPPLPRGTTATVLPAAGVTGADVEAVKFTQSLRGYKTNEVDWVLGVLSGADRIECDSGADDDPVAGPNNDGKDPFKADGLAMPWKWVTGNHDVLVVGITVPTRAKGYIAPSTTFGAPQTICSGPSLEKTAYRGCAASSASIACARSRFPPASSAA